MGKRRKCLIKACGRDVFSRGLCKKCYDLALKAIKSQRVTDQQLVELGLIEQKHLPRTPFNKQLSEALK